MILALSGRIGSGKDLVAKMIQFHLTNEKRISRNSMPLTWNCFIDPKNQTVSNFRNWDESGWQIKKFAGKLKQIVSLLTSIPVEDLEKEEVKNTELGREWNKSFLVDDIEPHKMWPVPQNSDLESYQRRFKHVGKITTVSMTVRQLLQKLGTEALRDVIHPNIHVNALFSEYKVIPKCNVWELDHPEKPAPYYHPQCFICKKAYSGYKLQPYCKECAQIDRHPNWLISDCRFENEAESVKFRNGIVVRINRNLDNTKNLHPSETSLDTWNFDYVINNTGTIEELLTQVQEMLLHFKIIND